MYGFTPNQWLWAEDALQDIREGRARGNRLSLVIRAKLQQALFSLGCCAQRHASKVILLGLLFLTVFAMGLMRAKLETDAETLWIEIGGRLQKELNYSKVQLGEGSGNTNELLIQTPRMKGKNILSVDALKEHLRVVKKATEVTVEIFDQTWTLKDLCYSPHLPEVDDNRYNLVQKWLLKVVPCVIITPLDCFWDGAKIHGPEDSLVKDLTRLLPNLKWTQLNPSTLIPALKSFFPQLSTVSLSKIFKEAGITTGYMEKPCLDPTSDPECPAYSRSRKVPDIGVQLTGGCHGFATKYMKWPEELIVGGVNKNRSGTIRSAEALQSIIQLMGEKNLHVMFGDSAKVQHIDWTLDAAKTIIQAWQRNFTKVVNDMSDDEDEEEVSTMLAFSSTSFNDLLQSFSSTSVTNLILGYGLMLLYSCLTLKKWNDAVQSQGALGFAGVLLVTLSVVSGLGFCAFCGIAFNVASTQVLPFLALGLGVDDMFLLAHTYTANSEKPNIPPAKQAGYCLASSGVSVLLTSFTNMFAFFMAALIPIPALRSFSLQAGIIVVFNFFAVVVIFPAMMAIDVSRRNGQRTDIFCCIQKTSPENISITPDSTLGGDFALHHLGNSSCSLSADVSGAANVQASGISTVFLPGSVHATAMGTLCLPGAVTVQASAVAGLNSTASGCTGRAPVVLDETGQRRTAKLNSANLSATGNIDACNTRGNVPLSGSAGVQVHLAGSSSSDESVSRERTRYGATKPAEDKMRQHPGRRQRRCECLCEESLDCTDECRSSRRYHNARTRPRSCPNCRHSKRTANSKPYPTHNTTGYHNSGHYCGGNPHISPEVCSRSPTPPGSAVSLGFESLHDMSPSPRLAFSESRASSASKWKNVRDKLAGFSLTHIAKVYYGPWLQKFPVKILVLFLFAGVFGAGAYGCMRVEDGLDLSDVVPRHTKEHSFIESQFKYFSFYQIFAVTMKDFDYPRSQKLLYRYHEAFAGVENIIKTPEMKLPPFWLAIFRDWLKEIQAAFDADWAAGFINQSGWSVNASDNGVIGFKLLLQTGNPDDPHNESQVGSVRLVDSSGIIRPQTFYHCLTVWHSMDPLGYTSSQGNLHPIPEVWSNKRSNENRNEFLHSLTVPVAEPIVFAQMPFYLNHLRITSDFVTAIKEVRAICDKFSKEGLPSYPSGIPFTFWEQYIWLRHHLLIAIAIVLATSFLVMATVLWNPWAAVIIVLDLIMITVELFGFMGLAGLKLSAVPAVTLILSVGVGVEFTVHMVMAFMNACGDRNQRMQKALEHVFSPTVDGGLSTLLGVIMLAGSEFEFIVRYFFHLLVALIVIGSFNGLVFLPVLLSLAGPAPQVEDIRPPGTSSSCGSHRELLPSSSCQRGTPPTDSQLFILDNAWSDPVMDSTTRPKRASKPARGNHGNRRANQSNTPPRIAIESDSASSSTVTKVTATATVTFEVHTERPSPMYGNFRAGPGVESQMDSTADQSRSIGRLQITDLDRTDGQDNR